MQNIWIKSGLVTKTQIIYENVLQGHKWMHLPATKILSSSLFPGKQREGFGELEVRRIHVRIVDIVAQLVLNVF